MTSPEVSGDKVILSREEWERFLAATDELAQRYEELLKKHKRLTDSLKVLEEDPPVSSALFPRNRMNTPVEGQGTSLQRQARIEEYLAQLTASVITLTEQIGKLVRALEGSHAEEIVHRLRGELTREAETPSQAMPAAGPTPKREDGTSILRERLRKIRQIPELKAE